MNEFDTLVIGGNSYPVQDTEARRLARKTLNILCFGNSFLVDQFLFLPMLLKEAMPDADIALGMCFQSDCAMSQHASMFSRETAYEKYHEWTTAQDKYQTYSASVTGKAALARRRWDVIVLHQTANKGNNEAGTAHQQDWASLKAFADLILDEIDHPVAFALDIPHPESPGASGYSPAQANADFALFSNYAKTAFETLPYISAVLPTGTAVQNLRSASIAQGVGETGWLTYDDSHLQQGLGTLCAGWAACVAILAMTGEKPKGFGFQFRPDSATPAAINYNGLGGGYGQAGVTEANVLLAQKCAMMAAKEPFAITDCSGFEAQA